MKSISKNRLVVFIQQMLRKSSTNRKSPALEMLDTAPLSPKSDFFGPEELPARRTTVASAQSTGLERSHNEDTLFHLNTTAMGQEMPSDFGLYIVADGMGGHRSGEVASALSVNTVVSEIIEKALISLFKPHSNDFRKPIQELVREALDEANLNVVERVPGGGTTLTVALRIGNQITIGHVGDSRAYFVDSEQMHLITRDHSLVERLVELGQITLEESAVHPQRNVLYRAIGQGANLEVDVSTFPIPHDGYLMICSDGLWGVVKDESLQDFIVTSKDLQEACNNMVNAANKAGGPDNISVVLVYFPTT